MGLLHVIVQRTYTTKQSENMPLPWTGWNYRTETHTYSTAAHSPSIWEITLHAMASSSYARMCACSILFRFGGMRASALRRSGVYGNRQARTHAIRMPLRERASEKRTATGTRNAQTHGDEPPDRQRETETPQTESVRTTN